MQRFVEEHEHADGFQPLQVIFGILSDRFGWKWPLVIDLLICSALELGAGFVHTFSQFLALRSLFGITMGGIWGLASSTALENLPIEVRGLASAGIRCRISHCGCDKPSPGPSHIPYMASSLLGLRGNVRLCRSHSDPPFGERGLPLRESSRAREGLDDWEEDPRFHTPSWSDAQDAPASVRLRYASDDG